MVVPRVLEAQIPWDGEFTPDLIVNDVTSEMFVKVSKELAEGDRYVYRRASVIHVEF